MTLAPHRIPHEIIETAELVDTFDDEHPDLVEPQNAGHPGQARVTSRMLSIEACPDCGRNLQAARDDLAPVYVLVCPRLEGLDLRGVADLTPADIVACGEDR